MHKIHPERIIMRITNNKAEYIIKRAPNRSEFSILSFPSKYPSPRVHKNFSFAIGDRTLDFKSLRSAAKVGTPKVNVPGGFAALRPGKKTTRKVLLTNFLHNMFGLFNIEY